MRRWTLDPDALTRLLPALSQVRLLVVGDLILDDYWIGRATRLSREAPVPVLESTRRVHIPGGGANPALNARALGARVRQIGVVGDDPEGRRLRDLLAERGIDVAGVVVDPGRPTTWKVRILAEGGFRFPQQVARIDRQVRRPIEGEVEVALVAALSRALTEVDAVLFSDYRSGALTPALIQPVRSFPLWTVDAQGGFERYRGAHLVKCNRREAEQALGRPLDGDAGAAWGAQTLRERLSARCLLLTRGEEGMTVATEEGIWHLPPTNRTEVFDVTGAGDTVIAVATLALAAGAHPLEAAALANVAAGLVIRRLGNAVVSPQELGDALKRYPPQVQDGSLGR